MINLSRFFSRLSDSLIIY